MRISKLNKARYVVSASVLAAAALAPVLTPHASAYNLVGSRSIQMSSSVDGSLAAGQDVTYKVKFNVSTVSNVGGVLVQFCSNSPIIGDTCTAPSGLKLDITGASTGDTVPLGLNLVQGITGFTIDTTHSSDNRVVISSATPDSPAANETYEFELGTAAANDGITNPTNSNTPFYARIVTYDTATDAGNGDVTNVTGGTGAIDAGGVALSTASQVTIQSKVQERLTFCIYTGVGPCPGSISNPVILGDSNGVLDPGTTYTTATNANGNPKFGLASNAAGNVIVRMKGGTLKRTPTCLDGIGQNCSINPIGGTAAAPAVGVEQFGVRLTNAGAGITAATPYTVSGNYAFDDNNTTGTQSTYGSDLAVMTAGTEQSAEMQFVGDISATTESGIYSTTLTFIATGTY